mgnify:CR=1 FL=1
MNKKNFKIHLALSRELYEAISKEAERLNFSKNKICEILLCTSLNLTLQTKKEDLLLCYTGLGEAIKT